MEPLLQLCDLLLMSDKRRDQTVRLVVSFATHRFPLDGVEHIATALKQTTGLDRLVSASDPSGQLATQRNRGTRAEDSSGRTPNFTKRLTSTARQVR